MNRGLNFGVLSGKLDITQVFVDLKKFDRTMIWKEWWHGHTTEEEYDKPMFKTHKTNLPANYKVPNGLKTYLSSVKSEVVDPKNRIKVKCNLPEDELEALKELVKLQRDKKIIIKQCDKGAGIIVLNYEDYINACNEHLKESMKDHDGTIKQYYKKVNQTVLEEAKNKILRHIQSGYDNEIISKPEFEAMCPESKKASKLYCNFKIHKEHEHIPPVRAIISGSGSILENPSKFVDFHLKDLADKHESYIQDTPDFIRKVEELNKKTSLPQNALLVTLDVKALFTNIPQTEGTQCSEKALNKREKQNVPTEYIIRIIYLNLIVNCTHKRKALVWDPSKHSITQIYSWQKRLTPN